MIAASGGGQAIAGSGLTLWGHFMDVGGPQRGRTPARLGGRVEADGNHLALDGRPFRVRGVTYGSFVPREDGQRFPERWRIKTDVAEMAARGLNVLRTYTVPPPELLDIAAEFDMRVLVGIDFRDWRYEEVPGRRAQRRVLDAGLRALDEALELSADRPEVLAISVGNEVPADVVRAHGIGRVEDGIETLIEAVHAADVGMLATYSNFPTTEFLQITGQDIACCNVFLEDPDAFRRYMRHLQVTSHETPLLITELGLASETHGERAQADALDWQLRIVDECGIAGAFVFSWTDEWGVGDEKVSGWGFGITDENRNPKPSLDVVESWARSSIQDLRAEWPTISVVVCVYNCEHLVEKCLRSLQAVDYPALEVIVCDDGSTDRTLDIAKTFPFRVLALPHGGLSNARNAGIAHASGEIVAFLDSDAFCHPEWPYHLALSLEDFNVVATGGPNLPVEDAGWVEHAVAQSPGSPVEVLVADDRAEHVPGCNMAYRKWALEAIGGFNPLYTAAGDDVDVCWNILDIGWEIGFAPAAQVRHHRRDSVRGYLKQQRGYGRAESLLMPHHRHRFNHLGQAKWAGFVYGGPRLLPSIFRPVVYHGYAGLAPYQPVAKPTAEVIRDWAVALAPLMFLVALLGLVLAPFSYIGAGAAALSAATMGAFAVGIAMGAAPARHLQRRLRFRALVAFLHIAQPLVRTWARARSRIRTRPPTEFLWTGDRVDWVRNITRVLKSSQCGTRLSGPNASWDVETWKLGLVCQRITTAILWGWTPVVRRDLRLRRPAWFALGCVAALSIVSLPTALAVLVALVSAGILEALWLRRRVDAAVRSTTHRERLAPAATNPEVAAPHVRLASDPRFPPTWFRKKRGVHLPAPETLEKWVARENLDGDVPDLVPIRSADET